MNHLLQHNFGNKSIGQHFGLLFNSNYSIRCSVGRSAVLPEEVWLPRDEDPRHDVQGGRNFARISPLHFVTSHSHCRNSFILTCWLVNETHRNPSQSDTTVSRFLASCCCIVYTVWCSSGSDNLIPICTEPNSKGASLVPRLKWNMHPLNIFHHTLYSMKHLKFLFLIAVIFFIISSST
jgi:hypothetical protein